MADGPIVQAAGKRALKAGVKVRHVLTMVREFRRDDDATPIILMGYLNPILSYGAGALLRRCRRGRRRRADHGRSSHRGSRHAGAAGHRARHRHHPPGRADHATTSACRWCCDGSSGFVYYVSITGITGTRSTTAEHLAEAIPRIRRVIRSADRGGLRRALAGAGGRGGARRRCRRGGIGAVQHDRGQSRRTGRAKTAGAQGADQVRELAAGVRGARVPA